MLPFTRSISRQVVSNHGMFSVARAMSTGNYQNIKTEIKGKVGIITLYRPKALNALCDELVAEVLQAGKEFDTNKDVGAIIITGMSVLYYHSTK